MTDRRFPAPWTVELIDGGLKVVDAQGQSHLGGLTIVKASSRH